MNPLAHFMQSEALDMPRNGFTLFSAHFSGRSQPAQKCPGGQIMHSRLRNSNVEDKSGTYNPRVDSERYWFSRHVENKQKAQQRNVPIGHIG